MKKTLLNTVNDTFLGGLIIWLKAALSQGQRLLSAYTALMEFSKPGSLFLSHQEFPKEQLIELTDRYSYEEDFFVFAFDRAIFFLKKASESFSQFKILLDQIENVNGSEQVKDIRDMRVHIDNYLAGKGKNQSRFLYNIILESESYESDVDAFTSVATRDTVLIGGRIDVRKSLQAIEELLSRVMSECENIYNESVEKK